MKIKKPIQLLSGLSVYVLTLGMVHAQSNPVAPKETNVNCFISEFRFIATSIHEPLEREKQAKNWLIQNISACSAEKLNLINSNRASWLGTSDSPFFMTMVDTMIEYKLAGKPEMLAQIFNSAGKEGTSSVQITSVTQAPRAQAYDAQMYQQQPYAQPQQQPYAQPQQQPYAQQPQQPVTPQMAYPQAAQVGGR